MLSYECSDKCFLLSYQDFLKNLIKIIISFVNNDIVFVDFAVQFWISI